MVKIHSQDSVSKSIKQSAIQLINGNRVSCLLYFDQNAFRHREERFRLICLETRPANSSLYEHLIVLSDNGKERSPAAKLLINLLRQRISFKKVTALKADGKELPREKAPH